MAGGHEELFAQVAAMKSPAEVLECAELMANYDPEIEARQAFRTGQRLLSDLQELRWGHATFAACTIWTACGSAIGLTAGFVCSAGGSTSAVSRTCVRLSAFAEPRALVTCHALY